MRAIRRYRYVLVAVAVILAALYARVMSVTVTQLETRLPSGTRAPDFTLVSSNDQLVTLSRLQGQPVYLVFMATDCAVSAAEMPTLEQWAAANPDISVLAVGRASPLTLAEYASDQYPHITFLADFDGRVWNAYGAQSTPTGYVVDGAGWIRFARFGGPARLEQFDLHVQFTNTDWKPKP